ncbi:MAG TPA: sarcosine oxidase subunit gamma [Rhizobiaceae bacterium]|nr:sarcosine oxidase subunit gamma [Rhizobiaceae bacterium]
MADLDAFTALGADSARTLLRGTLTIEENPGLALASLALRRGAVRPTPFDLALPAPGRWTGAGPVCAFWIAPDQWMIGADGQAESDFAAELATRCPGCSVTEQTDGFVAYEIRSSSGDASIIALLAKLVNIDPVELQAGRALRTGLEHQSVYIIRRAADHLAILGMRSFAEALWHALETARSRIAVKQG